MVGTVAVVEMAFRLSVHVGSVAAEPQQLYLRLQQALDELARRHAVLGDAEALLHLRGDLDRLGAALEDTAALRYQLRAVVGPGRARQIEKPLALRPGGGRIGVGIDEDVQVIEGGKKQGVLRDRKSTRLNSSH